MDLMELSCEDGRWMELVQDRVQWRALVLAVLSLQALLPENWFTILHNKAADRTRTAVGTLLTRN
jgi:hypothetical protein